jgi:hypothetical protein
VDSVESKNILEPCPSCEALRVEMAGYLRDCNETMKLLYEIKFTAWEMEPEEACKTIKYLLRRRLV